MTETSTAAPRSEPRPPASLRRREGRGDGAGRRGPGPRWRADARWGWVFSAPALIVFALFLLAPIATGIWVSFTNWTGQTNPLAPGGADLVGLSNYRAILGDGGLLQQDFVISIRNTAYFVLIKVPLVTAASFLLALVVNNRLLKGRGFFRTAFYFPSITSSVAIALIFMFLFSGSGMVNTLLGFVGIDGPTWFNDPRGLVHLGLSVTGLVDTAAPPAWLAGTEMWGLSLWQWISGPSVALTAFIMMSTWATTGIFMLFFLAGLQNIPLELDEAAAIDGASTWQRFRYLTVPLMRRSIVLVVTLSLIGTWQVFDSVYIISQGAPAKTTLTPAFLAYERSFSQGRFGQGAAMAFILAAIIVILTIIQRLIARDREVEA